MKEGDPGDNGHNENDQQIAENNAEILSAIFAWLDLIEEKNGKPIAKIMEDQISKRKNRGL